MNKPTLYDQLGGQPVIERVHKIFYDAMYAHPWLGQLVQHREQEVLENQQTDFMVSNMGGPERYSGAFPGPAHQHIHITDEMFDLRQSLLRAAIREVGVAAELEERWLRIDEAFRHKLVKSEEEVKPRYRTGPVFIIPNPEQTPTRA